MKDIRRRKLRDRATTVALYLLMAVVMGILAAMLGFLVKEGRGALSWEFFTRPPRDSMTRGGILTPIIGTIQLIAVSMTFAFPVGVMTAVYLVEWATDSRFTRFLRLAVRSLGGVPSVVFGLFGLSFFVVALKFGSSLLAAGLTLGCLALPVIVAASESALLAVPKDYRDASFAMGATRWQTICKVVLPAALPSIITGAILSIGRVAGETAPIIFTGAAFFTPHIARSVFDEVMALPYHILVLATAGTHISETRPIQYGTVLVLLFIVMGISLIGVFYRARLRMRSR